MKREEQLGAISSEKRIDGAQLVERVSGAQVVKVVVKVAGGQSGSAAQCHHCRHCMCIRMY